MTGRRPDAVVIGSGPNGLAAAVALARKGAEVLVLEADDQPGGGTRTGELTLPGFVHDICSAVHPMGILSPFFRTLPLGEHGLEWITPPASVAHPLPDGPAVLLRQSVEDTADGLGRDARAWTRLVRPFLRDPHALLADLLAPLRLPAHPLPFVRFGLCGAFSANRLARLVFREERARALFAGHGGDDPRASEGIVLVDDIDLHLGPALEGRICDLLERALPAVQWIVTTTSVRVASSRRAGEVVALRHDPADRSIEVAFGTEAMIH